MPRLGPYSVVSRTRRVEADSPSVAEFSKFTRDELGAVIGYYLVRQAVATYDVLPRESLDFFFC